MKLDTDIRILGPVDHLALKAAVCAIEPDAWLEDDTRQDRFKEVHSYTRSIIMIFCQGWPNIQISKRKGFDYFGKYMEPLVQSILAAHYKPSGVVIRAMVAKLLAGGVIRSHRDGHETFAVAHRIHVPLVTNDMIDFVIGGNNYHLKEGLAYEVNNLDWHSVHNRSAEDRIHFIFDYAEQ